MPDSSPIQLPCGRCIGCRLERSRQWALRLTHENRFHEDSCFLTLTYDEEHLPAGGTLVLEDFQAFMKRLRKSISPKRVRFFHAGEYGEKRGRPHYHCILFGHGFESDRYDLDTSARGDITWSSRSLDRLWPFGINRVGGVTFESCAYVARYVTKKVTGDAAEKHYQVCDPDTGEIFQLRPEYATMSRNPGIGAGHFKKYRDEIYPSDMCVSRGRPSKPPRFYDKLLEKDNLSLYESVKEEREFALALSDKTHNTERRLSEREYCKLAELGQLTRRYEIA